MDNWWQNLCHWIVAIASLGVVSKYYQAILLRLLCFQKCKFQRNWRGWREKSDAKKRHHKPPTSITETIGHYITLHFGPLVWRTRGGEPFPPLALKAVLILLFPEPTRNSFPEADLLNEPNWKDLLRRKTAHASRRETARGLPRMRTTQMKFVLTLKFFQKML